MSDILLSVGLQRGGIGTSQLEIDIRNVVSEISKNPPKVSVGLQVDQAALNHFKTQLTQIVNSVGLSKGAPITVNISGIGEITAQANNAKRALDGVAKSGKQAADAVNNMDTSNDKVVKLEQNTEEYRKALGRANNELVNLRKNQAKWTAAKSGRGASDYAALGQYEKQLESLIADLNTGKMTMDEFNQRFGAIKAGADKSRAAIRGFNEDTKSLGDRIKGLAEKFSTWLSVSQVIMMAVRTIKKMVTAVREVDAAMTELKKVTNETDATYNRFLAKACDRARQLGAAVSDVVTATADFARLGYNIDDASTLADTALVYKNIGDGIEDITTASKSIISTMQAFGIEASDAMSIVDRFNEVGNNFAISSAGIGEAMQRSAAAMASANNTIDETIALITAANTIVQNPESVGTTLKTVSMYLRAAKTEAEEAGESTDGMANSVSELRGAILELTGQKVDIQIDEDTFKSTYQILQELSEVWDEVTDISQANLLEMIGGKRNSNVVSALLENFSVAEEALKSSMESAGSALAENEKHLDSINGKIEIFTASFQTLATTLIDSEFVKGVVDFGTSILDALTGVVEMVDSLGGLSTVLLTVASAFLIAKKGALALAAVKEIILFFTKIKTGISNVINVIPSAIAAWKAYAAGTASASAAMQASIPVIGLVLSAITLLVAGFSLYNDTIDESRQKTHENASAAAELSEEVGGLAIEYISLNAAVAEDASAKESLLDVQSQLIESLGLEQYEIDKLIEKYGILSDAILQASKDALSTSEVDLRADINAYVDELREAADEVSEALYLGSSNNYGDTQAWYKEIQAAAAAYEALKNAGYLNATSVEHGGSNATYGTYEDGKVTGAYNVRLVFDWDLNSVEGIVSAYEELGDMLTLVGDTAGSNNYVYEGLYKQYQLLQDAASNYTNSIGALNSNLAQQYVLDGLIGKEVPATREEFNTYRQSVIDAAIASGEFVGSAEQIESAVDDVLKKEVAFADFYNSAANSSNAAAQEVVKNTQWMKNQIADTFASQLINMDDYAANTKAWDMAYAQFSGYVADYKDKLKDLSDSEIEFVFDLVVNKGVTDWAEIESRLASFDEAAWRAQQSWNTYIEQFSTIIGEDTLGTISSEITTLAGALTDLSNGTLGAEDVVELIRQFPELAEYVDFTADNFGNLEEGLRELIKSSPEDFIRTLQEFKETNNLTGEAAEQIDALCESVNNLSTDAIRDASGEFGVLAEAINAAKIAQTELEAALAEEDWDSGYEGRVNAFEGFQEVFDAGEYGSKAYSAYKEYFGLMEETPEQVKAWMESNKKYFTEGTDGVLAFLQTVEALSGPGGALEGIASFDAETGAFWYDINQLSAFADELGWTEEMLQDFIYKYRMYVEEWTSRSAQDNLTEFSNAGLVFDVGAETFASLEKLMEYTGLSKEGVLELVSAMNELREQQGLDPIQVIGSDQITITQATIDNLLAAGDTAEDVKALLLELAGQDNVTIEAGIELDGQSVEQMIANATGDGTESVSIDITMSVNDEEVIATVTTTAEQMRAILGEDWEAKISADSADAETRVEAVNKLLTDLPENTLVTVSDSTVGVRSNLSSVKSYLQYISNNANKTITITYRQNGSPIGMNASGTRHATRGPSLLGDEYSPDGSPKPELVVSNGRAYLAGQNGPEIGYLNDGDIVYTADETKRILRGNILHKSIPAHAGGTGNGLIDNGGLSGGNYNISGGKPSDNRNNKDKDEESWFERQYKDHQHWLEMDQESVGEYLKWLDEAYQKAYEEGLIDLDEYYKYQEEVYQGVQDQFKDHINDIDHEISLLEAGVGNSDEIINLSLQAMADIEAELAAARAAGLDENGDYIQWLEQQWLNYSENVTDMREQAETEAQSTIDNLVEYRIEMLKQEIQDQKDALSEQLDDLQDFYDKQRKMLQDQYDEEKYLEEQKEKRKSVTDIRSELAMLENDDSAWAQRRKKELEAELADAEKDLNSFERDHALDVTLDMLDEQQAAQEAAIQAEMDALDEMLNDPHALFNQALEDIKNNTAELYQQFIEYNRKYGTGNDQDIIDMWEDAYKKDLEYQDTHDGEHPDDIEIGNYTGYVPPEPEAPPEPPEDKPEDKPEDTPEDKPEKTYPYGKASDTSGNIGIGSSGTKVKAIQHALNELGFGNSGTRSCDGKFGSGTQNAVAAFQRAMGISADGIVGKDTRAKFKAQGYASGTDSATPGWHELFEGDLDEYIFTSSDGNRYRMFSGLGDKVLNAGATDFLYDFATSGGGILMNALADLLGLGRLGNISKPVQAVEIHSGDIIVQGNANERTVSEIRRAQRENLKFVITEFNKLNR